MLFDRPLVYVINVIKCVMHSVMSSTWHVGRFKEQSYVSYGSTDIQSPYEQVEPGSQHTKTVMRQGKAADVVLAVVVSELSAYACAMWTLMCCCAAWLGQIVGSTNRGNFAFVAPACWH